MTRDVGSDPILGPLVHVILHVGVGGGVGGLEARVQEGGSLGVAAHTLPGVLCHALDDEGLVEPGRRVAVPNGVNCMMDSEDPDRSSGELDVGERVVVEPQEEEGGVGLTKFRGRNAETVHTKDPREFATGVVVKTVLSPRGTAKQAARRGRLLEAPFGRPGIP